MAPESRSVPAKSAARAKPAATRAPPARRAGGGSSTASTADSCRSELAHGSREDFFAAALHEEDSAELDGMLQAMQTRKVSCTLCGESTLKQCGESSQSNWEGSFAAVLDEGDSEVRAVLEAVGKLEEAKEVLQRSLQCMNVDENAVRRQLARVNRNVESAQRKRWSTTEAAAAEAATLPKPQRTSDCRAVESTDPVSAQLAAARPPKRLAPVIRSVPAKSSAGAKPAATRANHADGADTMISSTASTADSVSCESTHSNREDSFAAAVPDEEDSELLDSMMQAMQTGKVSFTLYGESTLKQCSRLSNAAMGRTSQEANATVEVATGTEVVSL